MNGQPIIATVPHDDLIRLIVVCRRVGLSKSTVYKLIDAGKFPKQAVQWPNLSLWSNNAVTQWIEAEKAKTAETQARQTRKLRRVG